MNIFFKNKQLITSVALFAVFGFAVHVFATPPGSQYNPGETLDPSCIPGSTNCSVLVIPDQTGNSGKYLTTNGTSTSWATISGSGISSLNGLTTSTQTFTTGTTGTDFNISSSGTVHTFNLPTASATNRGLLSSSDWTTFNNKQNTLTFGNLTESTSSVLTITGGTGSVIGGGASIQVKQAGSGQSGFLSSSDWTTFNNKQNALGYTPLNPANNLSDLNSASTARTNLGLGTIATLSSINNSNWSGTVLSAGNGGTGVNNGSNTIALGGNISTAGSFATIGPNALTLNTTSSTNVTLPTTGTLATLAGSETLTNKTISGASNTFSNIPNSALSNSSITITTGTSGSDFNISGGSPVSLGGTVTLNIPDAGASARGLVTTGTQTFAGSKIFSTSPSFSSLSQGSLLFNGLSGVVSEDNSNLFWDNTGKRLGIGTNTTSNLSGQYFGSNQVNPLWVSSNSITGLVIKGTSGQAVQFVDQNNTATADFGFAGTDIYFVNRFWGGGLNFNYYDSFGSQHFGMTILGDGKVGIGTNAPSSNLEVNGGSNTQTDIVVSSTGDYQNLMLSKTDAISSAKTWTFGRRNDTFFGNQTGAFVPVGNIVDVFGNHDYYVAPIIYNPDGSLILTGASNATNGNVGIGNSSPSYKLDVSGDINFTGTLYQNGSPFSGGGGSVSIGDAIGSGSVNSVLYINGAGNLAQNSNFTWDETMNKLSLPANTTSDSGLQVGSLEFQSYSVNNSWIGENAYFNGAGFIARNNGGGGLFYFAGDEGQFRFKSYLNAGDSWGAGFSNFKINADGTVAFGGNNLSYINGNYSNATVVANSSGVQMSGSVTMTSLGSTSGVGDVVCIDGSNILSRDSSGSCSPSSQRFKHDITSVGSVLDELNQLRPISFVYNNDNKNKIRYGFIAEEVQNVNPELVVREADGVTPHGVYYIDIIPLLTKGIQELDLKITPITSLDVTNPNSLGSLIKQFLANAENTISDLYAKIINSEKVNTNQLCIGNTCIDENELKQIIQQKNNQTQSGTQQSEITVLNQPIEQPTDSNTSITPDQNPNIDIQSPNSANVDQNTVITE